MAAETASNDKTLVKNLSASSCSTQDSDDASTGAESPAETEKESEEEEGAQRSQLRQRRCKGDADSASPWAESQKKHKVQEVRSLRQRLAAAALWLLHVTIFTNCMVATALVLSLRWVLSFFVSGAQAVQKLHRPEARVSWKKLTEAEDPVKLAREILPVPPPLPVPEKEGFTITFAPCANLMIYTGGVACCLKRCPNYAEVAPKLRFHGNSCGAFVASVMAADVDMLEMLPEMLSWTDRFRGRLWGLVGAYSASITAIVWRIFSKPECFEQARRRLSIGVTTFSPMPGVLSVGNFETAEELVTTLLGSCYIPVAFEVPQWCAKHGPLWDGGIFDFACQGDVVISPYESVTPEVYPKEAYPKCFSFFPPHEADAVSLFEDGYMDCLRWLQNGAPSRKAEREEIMSSLTHSCGNIGPLLAEGKRFLLELLRGSA
eukprot:TRINITY_DN8496_c0_g1_i1.p1 TRINITY_DN8496_c0_g1~~TRINITY_DN8496_c0_g1_i1.p1  ORF type:complete len:455 (+),score=85.84 TRINITY_DN8496_c0_g1_i1:67-1365(+)